MPRIFDNIDEFLLPALSETLKVSNRADFCVGYFNLRGWKSIGEYIEEWKGGEGHCCRLLVGMQRLPQEDLHYWRSELNADPRLDNQTAMRIKVKLAEEFREQLTIGSPTNQDETCLRNLSKQIKAGKVVVKLFLKHALHAKLYLLFRPDRINPTVGFLGSSNLTHPGLSAQGELNVDVLDHDACQKLAKWFDDRWADRWCIDISDELVEIIDESWAREAAIPPYHIYLKMAYHLSQEARSGLSEFQISKDFSNKLLDFQTAAVKIAAHHLNTRGGVMIGDVVGLGKTLMATALARVFEDDYGLETLVLCPKNLVRMWEDYQHRYRLRAKILSISRVTDQLPILRRYRLIVIDESQNLRNREGQRYRVIQDYIKKNDSKCILLSATPYNKTYIDLSNQLRLFVPEDQDLGIRPERMLREMGETAFIRKHQASPNSLAAFDQSNHPDDWRELMRLFLVRRTRSFIQENYANLDEESGRRYLKFDDGSRSYFPVRVPKTVCFNIDKQYSQLFADDVVVAINRLELPRYGLGNYLAPSSEFSPNETETNLFNDLSRAGKRLMGFCRTNLYKRLESSGHAFILSIERHVLRNFVFLHAIENHLPLPIGIDDTGMLDTHSFDEDAENVVRDVFDIEEEEVPIDKTEPASSRTVSHFKRKAAEIYSIFAGAYKHRFRWIGSHHFNSNLYTHLSDDTNELCKLLTSFGEWDSTQDAKLDALCRLLENDHSNEKVLVFSQFADTVRYLMNQLSARGLSRAGAVTGTDADPTSTVRRFSPISNESDHRNLPEDELRILISTDVLSEGQNLQDCAIVVNYDLPWAIIRLIQRAGRVDRIGQQSHDILCYSFLPADGIERLIRLRARVRTRLDVNAEVLGTDEAFFEDEDKRSVLDLYNERAGVLDDDDDADVDLASYAYQIWKNATMDDPSLKKKIECMPPVVFSSKAQLCDPQRPDGVLVYMRTTQGLDSLAWMNRSGESVTESQFEILRVAQCTPSTPPLRRHESHHDLVGKAIQHIVRIESMVGGQLGRPSGARFRTYERLKRYLETVKDTLFDTLHLRRAIDDIYRYPLCQTAVDTLNRQLRSGISDETLAELVVALRDETRLCVIAESTEHNEPQIICSLGLMS